MGLWLLSWFFRSHPETFWEAMEGRNRPRGERCGCVHV